MAVTVEAYMVVTDTSACERCGAGHTWTICGPDGVNGSTSYADEADAEHEADILNAAYNAGRASGIADATPIQQCSRADGHDGSCNGLPRNNCKYWRAE